MMGRSHMALGTGCYILLAAGNVVEIAPLAAGAAIIGSLAPDIDTPHSLLGRWVPFLSYPLDRYVGHRTLTHSLPFLAGLAGVGLFLARIGYPGPVLAFMAGYASHILADMLTGGVCFMYPLDKRARVKFWPNVRTGSFAELPLLVVLLAALLGGAYLVSPYSHATHQAPTHHHKKAPKSLS